MVTWRMNITQEPATNTVPPFPFFVENPVDLHPNELPTDKNNINSEPLKSQTSEIPFPSHFHIDTNPLPERCQFMFSDGRQCAMARSDIHPSLCRFHSEREDQLFGEPSPGGYVVGASLDLPELYSACRDLTTAAGVNRALGQVFRLLAQRRISRQEAATFGHLAQLLLRTISAARAESTDLARSGVRTPVESREVMRESRNAESTGLPTPEIGAPLAPRTILREPSPRPSTCRSEAPHSESSSPLETGSATATGPSFAVEPRNSNAAAAGSAQHKSNGAAPSHPFPALGSAPATPSQ